VAEKAKTSRLVWIALLAVLVGYAAAIVYLHPTNFFGLSEDDSIYFTSARALAQGQGYVQPSLPGTPPATKYPILYPLLLSAVWKLSPNFPSNLPLAIAISVASGAVYLVAGFVLIRRWCSLSDVEALFITAFCAFNPLVLYYSAKLCSDIPFAALLLMTLVLADEAILREASVPAVVWCGVIAGLAVMMRIFGVTAVAGVLIAAAVRRSWRQALIFATVIALFFLAIAWQNILLLATEHSRLLGETPNLGWTRAVAYYTSYLSIWKVSVPNMRIFWAILQDNVFFLALGPARFLGSPLVLSPSAFVRTAAGLLFLLLAAVGVVRQARARGWSAVHYTLPFYLVVITLWYFPDRGNRFFLPFLFLVIAAAWTEIRRIIFALRGALFQEGHSWLEKGVASMLAVFMVVVLAGIGYKLLFHNVQDLAASSEERRKVLIAKREAYKWLGTYGCCAPVLAYEDGLAYLYSGRTSIRPVTFVASELHDDAFAEESVQHLMDTAATVKADLWIFSKEEFPLEGLKATEIAQDCLGTMGPSEWPIVFHSSDNHVIIRSLRGSNYANPCRTRKN
jgi:hypothetical protein